MNELECLIGRCLDAFVQTPTGTSAIILFGAIAIFSLIIIIKKDSIRSRIRWSYPLVFSLLFLLTYFTVTMTCHYELPVCTEKAFVYSIPTAIIGSIIFGYLLLPNLYLAFNKAVKSDDLSKKLPTFVPVYIADNGKPFAFSYGGVGKWIVVSQGMVEILSEDELTAVLLHEYGHLINNSSFYKLSTLIYSKIPVLHAFLDAVVLDDEEEQAADNFVIKTQGAEKYLNSAKAKLKVSRLIDQATLVVIQ